MQPPVPPKTSPTLVERLRALWADYLFAHPNIARPNLGDWLALLHIADTNETEIPTYLAQLLRIADGAGLIDSEWDIVLDLLALTFQASSGDREEIVQLTELQRRILRAAAQMSRRIRPSTGVLAQRAVYLEVVVELSQNLPQLNQQAEFYEYLVQTMHKYLGYETVHFYLYNAAKQLLAYESGVWPANHSTAPHPVLIPLSRPNVQKAVVSRQVQSLTQYPIALHPALPPIKSQLLVPLHTGQQLVGLLEISSQQPNAFDRDDVALVTALAEQIASIFENVALKRQLHEQNRQNRLFQIAETALEFDSDMVAVLQDMAHHVVELMGMGGCVICQYDNRTSTITAVVEQFAPHHGLPQQSWRKLNQPLHFSQDPLGKRLLTTARPLIQWADRPQLDPLVRWQTPNPDHPKNRWGLTLLLPLVTKRGVVGLIEMYDRNPNRYLNDDDIRLGLVIARQTSLAMERARLLDQTYRRLSEVSVLHTMTQKFTLDGSLEELLDSVVRFIHQMMDCRSCALYMFNHDAGQLVLKATAGQLNWIAERISVADSIISTVVHKREVVYVPDLRDISSSTLYERQVRSVLIIPLSYQDEIIGVLKAYDDQPEAFDQSQQQTLAITAGQIAMAIQNVTLSRKVADLELNANLGISHEEWESTRLRLCALQELTQLLMNHNQIDSDTRHKLLTRLQNEVNSLATDLA